MLQVGELENETMNGAVDPWKQIQERISWCERTGGVTFELGGIDLEDADFAGRVFAEIVAKFPNLEELSFLEAWFGNEGLRVLAAHVEHFSGLQDLEFSITDVGDVGLKSLAEQSVHLRSLLRMDLSNTQIGDDGLTSLAEHAEPLHCLSWLILTNTQVGDDGLTALAKHAAHLDSLQSLDLDGTQVGDDGLIALAEHAEDFSSLKTLDLLNTNVRCVSVEVLRTNDAQAIFAAVLKGIAVAEAKLVVLGEPWVGKSWMCQRFFRGELPSGERQQTHDFELIRPEWRPKVGELDIDLHVWDFGGQQILHGTHEMFLTQRSVCLLVLDVTQDRERDDQAVDPERRSNRLTYWLKMIRHFVGRKAHVILVVTQCDRLIGTDDNTEEPDRLGRLDPERLRIEFGFKSPIQIVPDFSAKAKDDSMLDPLRAAIKDAIDKLEVHSRVDPKTHRVKRQVEAKIQGRTLVSLSEYRTWCEAEGVTDRDSQDSILRTLHHFGSVFYFGLLKFEQERQERGFPNSSDDLPPGQRRLLTAPRDSCLKDWLINPHWLKWPVYEVMRASERKAELSETDIQNAVAKITSDRQLESHPQGTAVVQAVLELIELCLPGNGKWFFPRGLPNDAARCLTGWDDCETVTWDWGFFPEAVIHRFLVRSLTNPNQEVVNHSYWRTGAVLQINGAKGAVESQPESGLVTVRLRKTNDKEQARLNETFLNRVRGRLEDLIGREPDKEERPALTEQPANIPTPSVETNSCDVMDSPDPPAAAQQTVSQTQVSDFPTWDQDGLTLTFCGKSLTFGRRGLSQTDCDYLRVFMETPNKWLGIERILELYGERNWREAIEKEIETRSRQLQNSSQIDRDEIRKQLSERFKTEREKVNQAVGRLRNKLEATWGASNGQARLTIESKNLKHRIVVLSCDDNEMSSR